MNYFFSGQWTEYISNVFMLAKCANLLMFMRKNIMCGIAYAIFCLSMIFLCFLCSYFRVLGLSLSLNLWEFISIISVK